MMLRSGWVALSVLGALCATVTANAQQGFARLFNGRDMSNFTLVGVGADTYKVQDGVIICSGKPNGYFATKQSYRNYVLRFDWKYARPASLQNPSAFNGNSGLLVHIGGEHRIWPTCIEVQLQNQDAGNIFGLGGGKIMGQKNAEAQKQAIKPVGEWNREEVICQDGKITAKINGITVAEGQQSNLKEGPIGWQSEGAEIHFRNLEIKPL